MNVQSWKRWQWALVGALAGAAVGWADLSRRESELVGGEGFIPQIVFEPEFLAPPIEGNPRLKNFWIYRVGDSDVVEMERLSGAPSATGANYLHIKFAAPHPYK